MSLRVKLPLVVLASFILNVLVLGGYYQFFLSKELVQDTVVLQNKLDAQAESIAAKLCDMPDVLSYLSDMAGMRGLVIVLENASGDEIFSTEATKNTSVGLSASCMVELNGDVHLLKISKPYEVKDLSHILLVKKLMLAEVVIFFIKCGLLTVFIYFTFVRPTVALKNDMERYKLGIRPVPSKRKDELGQVKNHFVHLIEALESEKQKQNRIIASISHDIKNPLTSVMGYTERLWKENIDPNCRRRYLDTIYSKSKSIQEIIEEFDEYLGFNMQTGIKKQKYSALQICEVVREDFEEELLTKNVRLTIRCSCPSETLDVDIAKLRRIFGNLIVNSLDYADTQDLIIEVRCEQAGKRVKFSVSDNGKGVESSELDHIFEPLYTTDRGRSVSGLGLSICRRIIQMHGGEIWAQNNNKGGLTVSFIL